jgi:ankyrin repeat protein
MSRYLLALFATLALLGGCATTDQRGIDVARLHNAVVADDAAYVRDQVAARLITPNQRIAAPAYPDGAPLLTIAARSAAIEVIRYLIAAGVDLNARTPVGETALMLAAYFRSDDGQVRPGAQARYEEVTRTLVEAGASLENERYHYTPLAYAAFQGHERIVRYLLSRGARANGDAEDGIAYVNTPLMMAAIEGHVGAARWLLRAGADPRVSVYPGRTAIQLAMKYGREDLIPVLRCAERLAPGEAFAEKCEAISR